MGEKPRLGRRAIIAYNRLAKELAALNYMVRVAKPSGTLNETSLRSVSRAIRIANRLFRREPGLPAIAALDPRDPISNADLVLLVARLTAAGLAFEERYRHLTLPLTPAAPKWRDSPARPAPHRR